MAGRLFHSLRSAWVVAACLPVLMGAAVACGGGGADGTVGAAGGTVRTNDGALTVEIPPGALQDDTRITITRMERGDWPEELAEAVPLGDVFDLGPEGLTFAAPVTIVRRFDAEESGINLENGLPFTLLFSRDSSGGWHMLDNTVISLEDDETVVVTAETTHFSAQAAFGGSVAVSILPFKVVAQVGESWGSTVEIWVSPDVDVGLVYSRTWVVGSAGVVRVNPPYGTQDVVPVPAPRPGETAEPARHENVYTCIAAGTDTFGIQLDLRESRHLTFSERRIGILDMVALLDLTEFATDVAFHLGLADCQGDGEMQATQPTGVDVRTPTPSPGGQVSATATPAPTLAPGAVEVTAPEVKPGVRICGGLFGPCEEEP